MTSNGCTVARLHKPECVPTERFSALRLRLAICICVTCICVSCAPKQVQKAEIPQVVAALRELNERDAELIPVTFLVVQKRHHTRLYPTDRNMDRSGNVLPGGGFPGSVLLWLLSPHASQQPVCCACCNQDPVGKLLLCGGAFLCLMWFPLVLPAPAAVYVYRLRSRTTMERFFLIGQPAQACSRQYALHNSWDEGAEVGGPLAVDRWWLAASNMLLSHLSLYCLHPTAVLMPHFRDCSIITLCSYHVWCPAVRNSWLENCGCTGAA